MWFEFLLCAISCLLIQGDNNFDGPALYQLTTSFQHLETPSWDPRTNILYFTDIWAGDIHSYNYTSGELTTAHISAGLAPILQSKSDPELLIVGVLRDIVGVKWNRETGEITTKTLVSLNNEPTSNNINDGKADKQGRVWVGTIGTSGTANLYRVDKDLTTSPTAVVTGISTGNGMAFNKANDKVFYIDSPTEQIFSFDYDDESGEFSNRQSIFDLANYGLTGAVCDGMTIDENDKLWVALWGGGSVIQVDPINGEMLARYPIPATFVTSVMWGGPDLDILFITTSRIALSDEDAALQPGAGSVYALTNLGTKGLPVFEADIVESID